MGTLLSLELVTLALRHRAFSLGLLHSRSCSLCLTASLAASGSVFPESCFSWLGFLHIRCVFAFFHGWSVSPLSPDFCSVLLTELAFFRTKRFAASFPYSRACPSSHPLVWGMISEAFCFYLSAGWYTTSQSSHPSSGRPSDVVPSFFSPHHCITRHNFSSDFEGFCPDEVLFLPCVFTPVSDWRVSLL